MTNDLERRLMEHNTGHVKPTKAYIPWKIIYGEKCLSREEARAREKFFKSGSGREFRNEILWKHIPR